VFHFIAVLMQVLAPSTWSLLQLHEAASALMIPAVHGRISLFPWLRVPCCNSMKPCPHKMCRTCSF